MHTAGCCVIKNCGEEDQKSAFQFATFMCQTVGITPDQPKDCGDSES